jgi:predicted RNA-binding protein (virulence factor B family)
MLFHNEVFQPLEAGMHLSAFVKQVRPDGKIDLDKGDEFDDMILKHITTFYKNNIYR